MQKSKNKKVELTDKQKKKYAKINGFLMIYILTVIYNIILRAVLVSTATNIEDMLTRRIVIIQGLSNMVMLIWISVLIYRRKSNSQNNIIKLIIATGIINTVSPIVQAIYTFFTSNIGDTNNYYVQAINIITVTILSTIIWTSYFKVSKRVKFYFDS